MRRPVSVSMLLLVVGSGTLVSALGCAQKREAFEPLANVPFEIADWNFRGREGRKITTPHYEIFTTITEEGLLRALPQMQETAFSFYQTLVPSTPEADRRMPIYVFGRREEFTNFSQGFGKQRAQVLNRVRGGGYTERGIAVMEYVAHQITFPIMAHEGFHQYLHFCVNERVPAWLNEGLAVLCEGQRWSTVGLKSVDPWYNPVRRNSLAEAVLRNELMPVRELVRINAGHVVGGPTRGIANYYAQVWALMLFLREGAEAKYAAGFDRLLHSLSESDLEQYARAGFLDADTDGYNFGEGLFRNFISADMDAVETEYLAFLRERILARQ